MLCMHTLVTPFCAAISIPVNVQVVCARKSLMYSSSEKVRQKCCGRRVGSVPLSGVPSNSYICVRILCRSHHRRGAVTPRAVGVESLEHSVRHRAAGRVTWTPTSSRSGHGWGRACCLRAHVIVFRGSLLYISRLWIFCSGINSASRSSACFLLRVTY